MTIEKGTDWGTRGIVDDSVPVATSDASLADLFSIEEGSGGELTISGPPLVALLPDPRTPPNPRTASNGLARTVGARGSRELIFGHERALLPIDLGVVVLDPGGPGSRAVVMSSSLVIASRFWGGLIEGAMNSAFLHEWNVAPGGHPNDGRFDVICADLSMSDRLKAKKRLLSGSHIPHPDISIRRLKNAEFVPSPGASVWIDGRPHGKAVRLTLQVFADAVSIAI